MTLRCLEPSGNGAEGTRNQWGTAGSAEEPSPESARLEKALRELSQTGREQNRRNACERGRLPKDAAGGCAGGERSWELGVRWEAKNGMEKRPLTSSPRLRAGDRREDARKAGTLGMRKESDFRDRGLGKGRALEGLLGNCP